MSRSAFGFLPELPLALRVSVTYYLLHVVFQGKPALVELSAFWTIFFLFWSAARGECRLSFHILYFPLLLYGIASSLSACGAIRLASFR